MVYSKVDLVVGIVDQICAQRLSSLDIVDKSICGICALEEAELVEEVFVVVSVRKSVCVCGAKERQSRSRKGKGV